MFPIFCAICDWEEQGLDGLEAHLWKKHRYLYKKGLNKRTSPKQDVEKMPEPSGSPSPAYIQECETCKMVFHSSWSFRKHIRTAHVMNNGFRCEHCLKSFLTQAGMNRHKSQAHRKAELIQESQDDDDVEVLEVSTEFASVDAEVANKAQEVTLKAPKSYAKKNRSHSNLLSLPKRAPVEGRVRESKDSKESSITPQQPGPDRKNSSPELPKSTSISIKTKKVSKSSPPPEKRTKTDSIVVINPNKMSPKSSTNQIKMTLQVSKSSPPPEKRIKTDSVVVINSASDMDAINSNKTSPKSDLNQIKTSPKTSPNQIDTSPKTSPSQVKAKKSFVINCTKCNSSFKNATMLVSHIKAAHLA